MKFTPEKINLALICIVIFSIATKLLFVFASEMYLSPQTFEYEKLASNVLSGAGFAMKYAGTNYYTVGHPLYPLLCAVLYYFTNHSLLAILLAQILVVSLLCVLVFFIAKRQIGAYAGLLAALLVALHPGLFIYSTSKLHPLPLDAFLFAAVILMFLVIKDKPTLNLSILGGLILGICALSRSTILIFFLIAAGWFLFSAKAGRRRAAILMAIMGVFAFLVILPWSIRNYKVYKRPVLILNNLGLNLWIGNNPNASGSALTREGEAVLRTMPEDNWHRFLEMNEMEQGDFLKDEALRFIEENPVTFLKLYFKKMFYFWWFSPQSGLLYPKEWLNIYKTLYAVMLVFFALGLYQTLFISKNKEAILILLFFLSICATQAIFFVEGRHRWAIEPLMMIYVAASMRSLKAKFINFFIHSQFG